MNTERRAGGEVLIAGRRLRGIAMPYGTVSPDFGERFEPGAFAPVPAVSLNIQHDASMTIVPAAGVVLRDGPAALEVRAELPQGAASLVRRGALRGLSVEFNAIRERLEACIRVVERATLTGIGLVDRPAYPAAGAEVRARSGRTVRQRIPSGEPVACECAGLCKRVMFMQDAMREAIEAGFQDAVEVLAVRGSYGTPLASKSAGSVRATLDGDDAIVEVDLPTGPDGDAVLRDIENTGAVVVRPYVDRDLSEGDIERRESPDDVLVYRKIVIRSFVVGATDARDGWPEPEVLATPDMPTGRKRPVRRRIWL